MSKVDEVLRERGGESGGVRDELADLIDDLGLPLTFAESTRIAYAITEAGWRPPVREVTTVEELDSLPHGTLITSGEGTAFQCTTWHGVTWYSTMSEKHGDSAWLIGHCGGGTFRVVWEPEGL